MMKTISRKICLVLCLLVCVCFGTVALMQITPSSVEVSAATSYATTDFKMLDKASVRKANNNGIRFATFIGNSSEEAGYDFVNDYEMGTLFIPKSALEGDLTIDNANAVVAKFDGDTTKLQAGTGDYANGKLFNAVLELSGFVNSASAMNGKIVARTYLKNKTTNAVDYYCDAVEFSPAYVAACALDENEEGTVLDTYVAKLPTLNVLEDAYELEEGDQIDLPATTAEGINITYTATSGTIEDGKYTAGTEDATITASIAGGKQIETAEVSITASEPVAVANAYVVDYQATNGVIPLTLDGALVGNVTYAGSKTATVSENNVAIKLGMITGSAVEFTYSTATSNYTSSIKINPVINDCYAIEMDSTNMGYTVFTSAQATNVKFNGAAAGAGITVSAEGIHFAKSVFTANDNQLLNKHNKLEYTVGTTNYIVSVCAIENKYMFSAINFEDGQLSPFMSIVTDGKFTAEVVSAQDEGFYANYYNSTSGNNGNWSYDLSTGTNSKVKNTKVLKLTTNVDHHKDEKLGTIYISSGYFVSRRMMVKQLYEAVGGTGSSYADSAATYGASTLYDIYKMCHRMTAVANSIKNYGWTLNAGEGTTNLATYANGAAAQLTTSTVATEATNWSYKIYDGKATPSNSSSATSDTVLPAVYDSTNDELKVDYLKINLYEGGGSGVTDVEAGGVTYFDDIFTASNSSVSGSAMHLTNATILNEIKGVPSGSVA